MSFNGSGVFVRLYNWVNDAAANIKIRADRMDNEMNGFATGLTTCITKDGQTTITANLPMAGFKHTGVGDAANRTDYAAEGQVQDGKLNWVAAGGTADAITAAYTIPITALVDGQICYVRAGFANATTTPTYSPSSLTARTIVKNGGQPLIAGDIYGAGHELILRYYLASTRWELLNPAASVITLGTGVSTFLATPSSANLKTAVTDETGSGALVFATSPTLVTPLLGTPTSGTLTNCTGLPVAGGGTGLATLTANNVILGNGTSAPSFVAPSTSGNVLTSNGTTWTSAAAPTTLTFATQQAATSGTSKDFSSIPAGVKRIKIMLNGVSTNTATNLIQVQLGTGGVVSSGYTSRYANTTTAPAITSNSASTGFLIYSNSASDVITGTMILDLIDSATNTWLCNGAFLDTNAPAYSSTFGSKALSGVLDQIRLTTVNGTATFDAGACNISYE